MCLNCHVNFHISVHLSYILIILIELIFIHMSEEKKGCGQRQTPLTQQPFSHCSIRYKSKHFISKSLSYEKDIEDTDQILLDYQITTEKMEENMEYSREFHISNTAGWICLPLYLCDKIRKLLGKCTWNISPF